MSFIVATNIVGRPNDDRLEHRTLVPIWILVNSWFHQEDFGFLCSLLAALYVIGLRSSNAEHLYNPF